MISWTIVSGSLLLSLPLVKGTTQKVHILSHPLIIDTNAVILGLKAYKYKIYIDDDKKKYVNADNDDNKINNVILDNDIIMVWTNLDNKIKKISLRYNGATYVLKFNEE